MNIIYVRIFVDMSLELGIVFITIISINIVNSSSLFAHMWALRSEEHKSFIRSLLRRGLR